MTPASPSGTLSKKRTVAPLEGWEPVNMEDVQGQDGYEGDVSTSSENAIKSAVSGVGND